MLVYLPRSGDWGRQEEVVGNGNKVEGEILA
jgi:hypothetical protein